MSKDMVSFNQACEILGVGRYTIYRWRDQGKVRIIPPVEAMIPMEDINRMMEERRLEMEIKQKRIEEKQERLQKSQERLLMGRKEARVVDEV